MGASGSYGAANKAIHLGNHGKNQAIYLRRQLMKRLSNWKIIALAALSQAFFALEPAITYACSANGHAGC